MTINNTVGYPRNLKQLAFFEENALPAVFALFLDSPEEIRLSRLQHRASAEQQRQDDVPEVIQKRFATFRNEGMAVVHKLEDQERCVHIDSSKSEAEVFDYLLDALRRAMPSTFGLT